jgi:hypothetical protein
MGPINKKLRECHLYFTVDILFSEVDVNTQGAFADMASQAYNREFESEADHVGFGVSEKPIL